MGFFHTIFLSDGFRPVRPPSLETPSGGVPRLRARRGDVGIAPYERAIENSSVGADAHIRPDGYALTIGRRSVGAGRVVRPEKSTQNGIPIAG